MHTIPEKRETVRIVGLPRKKYEPLPLEAIDQLMEAAS